MSYISMHAHIVFATKHRQKLILPSWREKIHEIIFEADTRAGKNFDVVLIVMIFASVAAVMLDSVESISARYRWQLFVAEWAFTIAFTIEYILRLISVRKPLRYARSFYGVVDVLSIIPTYLAMISKSQKVLQENYNCL